MQTLFHPADRAGRTLTYPGRVLDGDLGTLTIAGIDLQMILTPGTCLRQVL